jgi:magnesium-protoporphyrin IX monomethyl ester (oxidative) cyclase
MRANPHTLQGFNRLWIRFFLLAVFATMYVRDHLRTRFFEGLGMKVDWFDDRVLRLTNDIAQQVFPHTIDLDNPVFWRMCDAMYRNTVGLESAKGLRAAWLKVKNAACFIRMFVQPPRRRELPADVRLEPVW